MNNRWIQKAVKRKGNLRHWAEEHNFINKKGNIDLDRALKYAKRHKLKLRIKQIYLVKTLRKLNKR
jgi:hypothetical protein